MLAITVLAALVLLTACGRDSASAPGPRLAGDDAFEAAVGSVWENGGSRRIADMTDFDWDGLRIFAEGTSGAMINNYVEGKAVRDNYYEGSANLFVFTHGGKPVWLIMMSGDFLTRDRPGRHLRPRRTAHGRSSRERAGPPRGMSAIAGQLAVR